MKFFLRFLAFFAFCGALAAQAPVNDNCSGVIDLGVVPACPTTAFTNVNATASNIGFGNNPSCFNGGTAQRDVWFAFTTGDTLVDVSINLTGINTGPNGAPITNPQIAVYRGDCAFDGLAEIACISSPNGSTQVGLDILGLTPGVTYFLRINDYSATASPNWGNFTLCVSEYVPAFNIGEAPGTTACFGTLYDSGGPTGNYQNNQSLTFTVCPVDAHECIEIVVQEYNMELNRDRVNVYNGNSISAPLIGSVTGANPNNQPFVIQASTTGCVTLQFVSDGSVVSSGFALTWSCSPLACSGSSFSNPLVINSLPFSQTGASTCADASNFAQSPCGNDAFLNGPDVVYAFNSPGGICAGIQVTGANPGTGVLVLNGPPGSPNTTCVAVNANGTINSADLRIPGTYYIVVANALGCTPFNISITTTECELPAGLSNALCNPLNGCIEEGGAPSVFNFQDGFQDIDLVQGVNQGCWLSVGVQADFYWFTIQAQADGPFGFILAGAGPPSDIDFSVWGPFTQQQVCETPGAVINTVSNTQPIRSSWTGGAQPTGMADIHPVTGITVTDDYDCGSPATPGAGGDRFVRTIPALEGQVFVVLVNDFGNQIGMEGIAVDWSPSQPEVLAPLPPAINVLDTAICVGESVALEITSAIANISWVDPNGTLSCTNCPNPVATPSETTTYTALIDAVCYDEAIPVKVIVFNIDAGPDITVCRNEQIQIVSGTNYENATYLWTAPAGVGFSCTDCPDPLVTGSEAGNFNVVVSLFTPNCTLRDTMLLQVLPQPAPQFTVSDDIEICAGETAAIGGPATPGVVYSWSSIPGGFASAEPNPEVAPVQTTTYYLSATNAECPLPAFDSVRVVVFQSPELNVAGDTAVCQGASIVLGNTSAELDVSYEWTGPDDIADPGDPNTTATPQTGGTYTLRAVRGACEVESSFVVTITPIDIQILNPDTLRICAGDTVELRANVVPASAQATWTPAFGISPTVGNTVRAFPTGAATYTATVTVPGCTKTDRIRIEVDSLPFDRQITADPQKDPYCPGEIVLLRSTTYEPSDFPDIRFQWLPGPGFETADTLWNMVITTSDTATYRRVMIHRACVDTASITINVVQPPNPVVTPSDTIICPGQSVQLLAEDYGDYPISWMPQEGLSCTTCPNPIATPFSTTVYNLQVEVPNCPAGAAANIVVLPRPTVEIAPNQTICRGVPVQLNFDSDAQSTYTWTSSADPNFLSNDPLLVVTPLNTTTYTLVARRDDCPPLTFTVTITVVQPPAFSAGNDQTVCRGTNATFTATPAPDLGGQYRWVALGTDVTLSTNRSLTVNTSNLGAQTRYVASYTYGPDNGCGPVRDTVLLTVIEAPRIDSITADQDSVLVGREISFSAFTTPASLPGGMYSWSGPGLEPTMGGPTITVRPVPEFMPGSEAEQVTYTLVVKSAEGCTDTLTITVTVLKPSIDFPNVFTPNGDNLNDVFLPVPGNSLEALEYADFKIYNRWGQVVYDGKKNNFQGWDGTHNGQLAPSDVYVFRVRFRYRGEAEFEDVKGDLTLIR